MGRSARRYRGQDPHGSARKTAETRSSITSAVRVTRALWTAYCRPGASTGTTVTRTSARQERVLDTRSGRVTTGRRLITPMRDFILLISAHLEAGPLFQPARTAHYRRHDERRKARRHGHAALEYRFDGRLLDADISGQRSRRPARNGQHHHPASGCITKNSCATGSIGTTRCATCKVRTACVSGRQSREGRSMGRPKFARRPGFEDFIAEMESFTPNTRPNLPRPRAAFRLRRSSMLRDEIGRAGTRFSCHNWRSAGSGNLGGWAVARCLHFLSVLDGQRRHGRRHAAVRVEQIQAGKLRHTAGAKVLERASFSARISACSLRDELSAAALS